VHPADHTCLNPSRSASSLVPLSTPAPRFSRGIEEKNRGISSMNDYRGWCRKMKKIYTKMYIKVEVSLQEMVK
jgi:hypothetical protein